MYVRLSSLATAYLAFHGTASADDEGDSTRSPFKMSQHLPRKTTKGATSTDSLVVVGSQGIPVTMISFGDSPLQSVLLDLGSSLTWASALFTDSQTLQRSNEMVSIGYIGTNVSGVMAADTVRLGSLSAPLQFGLADQDVDKGNFNGLVGLSQGPGPTLMDSLHNSGAIQEKVLTLRVPDQHSTGLITFGANTAGPVEFMASNDHQSWTVTVSDAIIDGQSMNVNPRNAIVDSGNAQMAVGAVDAATINRALGAVTSTAETYYIPCDTRHQLEIRIGTSVLLVSPETYMGRRVGENLCASMVTGSQAPGYDWSLGMPFLANVNAVFDYTSHRMGFTSRTGGEIARGATAISSAASGPAMAIAAIVVMWVWCTRCWWC